MKIILLNIVVLLISAIICKYVFGKKFVSIQTIIGYMIVTLILNVCYTVKTYKNSTIITKEYPIVKVEDSRITYLRNGKEVEVKVDEYTDIRTGTTKDYIVLELAINKDSSDYFLTLDSLEVDKHIFLRSR
jgi:hypothetical protein